ncbi:MAG: DUF4405 domain-containing protein [Planctomycetes bacterium]|nr:DUF4405 domain-containing protein [Planctomycetota bacterium]
MRRGTLNFVIDLVSFVDLLALIGTGFIIKYVLPPGSGGRGRELTGGIGRGHIRELWSMSRHEWGSIHFYISALFVGLLIVHVVLHWKWLRDYVRLLFGLRG